MLVDNSQTSLSLCPSNSSNASFPPVDRKICKISISYPCTNLPKLRQNWIAVRQQIRSWSLQVWSLIWKIKSSITAESKSYPKYTSSSTLTNTLDNTNMVSDNNYKLLTWPCCMHVIPIYTNFLKRSIGIRFGWWHIATLLRAQRTCLYIAKVEAGMLSSSYSIRKESKLKMLRFIISMMSGHNNSVNFCSYFFDGASTTWPRS